MKKQLTIPIGRLALPLLLGMTMPAFASPPMGHPTPEQARQILLPAKSPNAAELVNAGTVLEAIHANEFTYLEIKRIDGQQWIAAPKTDIRPGTHIRYEEGAIMQNFYSKLLKRTFASVMFVDHIVVTAQP